MDWGTFYGPNQDILPPSVEEALYTFANNNEDNPLCPIMTSFYIHCKLSWIMYWDYTIEEAPRTLPTLHRQSWTKWWNKYDLSKCTSATILQSLKSEPSVTTRIPFCTVHAYIIPYCTVLDRTELF
ncbi:hypothetical protein CFOL_v3_18306 [Cephalotus follicularis]|uniref:Uncharacterized protein n=1 Tax=Cephalotus follicularis TaxID=3775 RepID=A0A1Q3C3L7_CEPFO|nr:hypothetical protein CFOL_v3_18306 [Cephalotus follicularis]